MIFDGGIDRTRAIAKGVDLRQHPYGMPPEIDGLSHALNKCPPDTCLPHLRRGRAFESYPAHKKIPPQKRRDLFMGWVMGLEPTTPGTTIQCPAN